MADSWGAVAVALAGGLDNGVTGNVPAVGAGFGTVVVDSGADMGAEEHAEERVEDTAQLGRNLTSWVLLERILHLWMEEGVTERRHQLGNPWETNFAQLAYPGTSFDHTHWKSRSPDKRSAGHPSDRTYRRQHRQDLEI